MKKVIIVSILIFTMILIFAAPSMNTTGGGLHTISAIEKMGRLTINTHTFGSIKDFSSTYYLSDSTLNVAWDTYGFLTMNYGLAYTFTRWLEVSVQSRLMADAIRYDNEATERITGNYASWGFGDTDIGVKLTTNGLFGSTDAADIGVYGFYRINTGDTPTNTYYPASFSSTSYQKKDGGLFRYFTSNSRDYGIIALISFITRTQVPMYINLNGGYTKRTINPNISTDNYWMYSASYAVGFGSFIPFVELYGRKYVGINYFQDKFLIYASGGIRFDTPAGIVITLGSDYRITRLNTTLIEPDTTFSSTSYTTTGWGAVPDWQFHFGLAYYYDFIKDIQPEIIQPEKKTIITGKIVDAETGKPLSAIITLPGYSENIKITTDSTGMYSIEVKPGTIRIRANREGYKWQEKGIIIEKGQTKIVDFALKSKKQKMGTITGKIVNKITGEYVNATIRFPDTDLPEIKPDIATGIYRIEMIPGTYTMIVTAEGYVNWSQPIVIEADKTLVQNIEMLKKGGKINLSGIYFDSGKATINPTSYPILDAAVEMLKKNPKVRIEIQGHTDSVGSASNNLALSQARAEAVRIYLINHGIEAWRITAKGYGETMPIAPNTTREGRAMNRRIEFLILGE